MRANWYGLLGKKFKDAFGHVGGAILGGLVGLTSPQNHGVPYSLTEEFTSVYRMHALLPDNLLLIDISAAPGPNKLPPLDEELDSQSKWYPWDINQVEPLNYSTIQCSLDLIPQDRDGKDRPDHVDLAALEVYRDRERKVARYNEFRRGLMLIPITKWEDLTADAEAIKTLREVYGDNVEDLDLLVGLMAEKKIPGFAISETTFLIFTVMATRRLEADRFFTSYFNEETYTKKGLE